MVRFGVQVVSVSLCGLARNGSIWYSGSASCFLWRGSQLSSLVPVMMISWQKAGFELSPQVSGVLTAFVSWEQS